MIIKEIINSEVLDSQKQNLITIRKTQNFPKS